MPLAQNLTNLAVGLRLGPLALRGRALLAPMAGVTDAAMRRLALRRGATLAFSEMVAAAGLLSGEAECRERAELTGEGPRAAQLVGCDPAAMREAAMRLEAGGAELIDVNMGCPAKRVAGQLAGSALLRDLDAAEALLAAVVGAVRVPVTVKTRLGWDETNRNAADLARRAEAVGVRMVTVHGRTRAAFYRGRADWRAVAEVVDAVSIPVAVNGDCFDADDARAMLAASGAAAVMIGRAATGAPWLVGAIARALESGGPAVPPPRDDRRADAQDHLDHLLVRMGEVAGLRHARKHLAAYAAREGADPELRRALVTTESSREAFALLACAFDADETRRAA